MIMDERSEIVCFFSLILIILAYNNKNCVWAILSLWRISTKAKVGGILNLIKSQQDPIILWSTQSPQFTIWGMYTYTQVGIYSFFFSNIYL